MRPQHARFSSGSRKHTPENSELQDSLPGHRKTKSSEADRQPTWRDVPSKQQAPATAPATVPAVLKAELRAPVAAGSGIPPAWSSNPKGGILWQKSQHPGGGGLPWQWWLPLGIPIWFSNSPGRENKGAGQSIPVAPALWLREWEPYPTSTPQDGWELDLKNGAENCAKGTRYCPTLFWSESSWSEFCWPNKFPGFPAHNTLTIPSFHGTHPSSRLLP